MPDSSRNRRPVPIGINNSTVGGGAWARHRARDWARLDFALATVDVDSRGPCLLVPIVVQGLDGYEARATTWRVRPVDELGARVPVLEAGGWVWAPARSVEDAEKRARAGRAVPTP